MHYRNPAVTDTKPTYLFGEAPSKNGEANVKKKRSNTKIEELITRNEVRRATTVQKLQSQDNVTVLTIDPPTSINSGSLTGDRPLYLPVKKSVQQSPPPITPILSPPPAFQDSKNRNKAKVGGHLAVHQPTITRTDEKSTPGKGMVFSRSFEYDSRNKIEYKETLTSKSFDYDLQPSAPPTNNNNLNVRNFMRRDKSPVFSTLTGISPSYLTKRPTPDKSPIFPKAIPGNSVSNNFTSKLVSNNNSAGGGGQQVQILGQYKSLDVEGVARSRRGQFTRTQTTAGPMSGFRNFGDNTTGINQRLNSCDSGARSGKRVDSIDMKFLLLIKGRSLLQISPTTI